VSAYLNKDGIYSGDRIVNYTTQGSTGARVNLGFFGAGGANYCHVKTSAGANGERMHKFEYDGYKALPTSLTSLTGEILQAGL
jgi:hypothetical protein